MTLCVQDRECLFGDVVGTEIQLNEYGNIVAEEWTKTAVIRPTVELDEWIGMPNHFHGIIVIVDPIGTSSDIVGATRRVAPTCSGVNPCGPVSGSVGAIIGQFKSITTKRINQIRNTPGKRVWQRNYYEHVIRDERELNRIRQYIADNSAKWDIDREHPSRAGRPSPQQSWMDI